jgi:hypothetical protein
MLDCWQKVVTPGATLSVFILPEGASPRLWLAEYLKTDLEWSTNPLGKPFIKNIKVMTNWSHSHGRLVLALASCDSASCEVGIDLEFHKKRDIQKLAERFYNPLECKDLQIPEFYRLWARKEALYKCRGGDFFGTLRADTRESWQDGTRLIDLQGPWQEPHAMAVAIKT